jgi:hypothetical protein
VEKNKKQAKSEDWQKTDQRKSISSNREPQKKTNPEREDKNDGKSRKCHEIQEDKAKIISRRGREEKRQHEQESQERERDGMITWASTQGRENQERKRRMRGWASTQQNRENQERGEEREKRNLRS